MTRVLVDTHALLWWLADDPGLSPTAKRVIAEPTNHALVSTASVWEAAIKRSLGKLHAPDDLPDVVASEGFTWLDVTPRHAWEVRSLPLHHGDPFDRLLIAQARVERAAIITADRHFDAYDVTVCW